MSKPKDMHGRELEPGWYWVLYRLAAELELAKLVDYGPCVGFMWLFAGDDDPVFLDNVAVHSGPIEHPYAGRWSACVHYPEFRRGPRCVYCGTFNLPSEAE